MCVRACSRPTHLSLWRSENSASMRRRNKGISACFASSRDGQSRPWMAMDSAFAQTKKPQSSPFHCCDEPGNSNFHRNASACGALPTRASAHSEGLRKLTSKLGRANAGQPPTHNHRDNAHKHIHHHHRPHRHRHPHTHIHTHAQTRTHESMARTGTLQLTHHNTSQVTRGSRTCDRAAFAAPISPMKKPAENRADLAHVRLVIAS